MNHNENKEIERLQDPEPWNDEQYIKEFMDFYYGIKSEPKHNGRETPGGDSAIDKGCTCPVLDNHHGLGLSNGNFWMSADCPLHGKKSPI